MYTTDWHVSEDAEIHIGSIRVRSDGTVRQEQRRGQAKPTVSMSSRQLNSHQQQDTSNYGGRFDDGRLSAAGSVEDDADADSMDSALRDYLDNVTQDNAYAGTRICDHTAIDVLSINAAHNSSSQVLMT